MNTAIYRYGLLLFFMLAGFCAKGQHITSDTITWNSVKAIEQAKNETVVYNCTFKTNADQTIDWIQNNGRRINHYTVTGTDGAWPDVSQNGQITYHVTISGFSGDMIFSKAGQQITIHLNISDGSSSQMNYIFYISSIAAGS